MTTEKEKNAQAAKRKDSLRQLAVWLPALTVVVALLYAGLAWFLLFVPKIGQLLPGGRLDNTAIEERIKSDQAYIDRIKASLAEYNKISNTQKERLSQIVPTAVKHPSLMAQLEEMALGNGMILTSLDVNPMDGSYSEAGTVPIEVTAAFEGGDTGDFVQLLSDVQLSLRLMDIRKFQYSPDVSGYSLQMDAYYLP